MSSLPNIIGRRTRATTADLDGLYRLLTEASAWLRARGQTQWQPPYPLNRFERDVDQGFVWMWRHQTKPAAMVTLYPNRPGYYPRGLWDDAVLAWYVCRFVVDREFSGLSVGEHLLDQLSFEGAKEGINALRLDVAAANPFLERYYLRQGFRRRHVAELMGDSSLFLERPTGATPM